MQQLELDELERTVPARVINVHRSGLIVSDGAVEHSVTLGGSWYRRKSEARPTVGDWVLLSKSGDRIERVLTRKSVFQRVVPGHKVDVQLIAANIDTLFVVSSCNAEFNESRLERYLALAVEAGVEPVVVLTKADLTETGELEPYLRVLTEEAERFGSMPEHQRWPIRDVSTPSVEQMAEILDAIDTSVEAGKVVYLHCMAGLGRTGAVVGCYLVCHGMSGDEALEEIPRLRRRDLPGDSMVSPYTEGQRDMVRAWTQ